MQHSLVPLQVLIPNQSDIPIALDLHADFDIFQIDRDPVPVGGAIDETAFLITDRGDHPDWILVLLFFTVDISGTLCRFGH